MATNTASTIHCTENHCRILINTLGTEPTERMRRCKKLAAACRIIHKEQGRYTNQISCATYSAPEQALYLPRFACQALIESRASGLIGRQILYKRASQPSKIDAPFIAQLNPQQQAICDFLMTRVFSSKQLQTPFASGILKLGAGLGKSYVAAAIIAHLKVRTVIVMHSSAMIGQWEEVIAHCMPQATIGHYHAKKKCWGDIMLVVSDSAAGSQFTIAKQLYTASEFYAHIGFAVFDECHLYCNRSGVQMFSSMCIPSLGLSATPDGHPKGFDRVIQWFLGPIIDAQCILAAQPAAQSVEPASQIKGHVHRLLYYGSPANTRKLVRDDGSTDFALTINQICEDTERDAYVLAAVLDGLNRGLFMFVFSDRREYLGRLEKKLRAMHIATRTLITDDQVKHDDGYITQNSPETIACLTGGASPADLKKAELTARVILTTYPFMGTGKSIVHMTGVVLATPRRNRLEQYVKRAFRLGSDTRITRHIYDIVDKRLSVQSQWYARAKYYKEAGLEISEMVIKDSEIDKINEQCRESD